MEVPMGVPSASRPDIANAASNLIAKAWVTASPSAIGSNRSVCQGKDASTDTIVRPLLLMTVGVPGVLPERHASHPGKPAARCPWSGSLA
jgi:hypothetical protein